MPRFSDEGDTKIRQVIDKLTAAWEVFAERNFDIGKGIPEGDETISQKVDTQEIGIRENFGAGGSLEIKGAGNTGLAARMADVRLIVESRDRGVTKHHQENNKTILRCQPLLIAGLKNALCRLQNRQDFANQKQ